MVSRISSCPFSGLFYGGKLHVRQEVDAYLDLLVRQCLVRRFRVGRHVELDEVSVVDGQDIHEVRVVAGLAGNEELGSVNAADIIGKRTNTFGAELLMLTEKVPTGFVSAKAGIEDIMLMIIKNEDKKEL